MVTGPYWYEELKMEIRKTTKFSRFGHVNNRFFPCFTTIVCGRIVLYLALTERAFMQLNDLLHMFAYDRWANHECLAAISAAGSVSAGTVGRLAHILSAQKLWLERIQKRSQSMAVWPSLTIDECTALADEMSSAWQTYLAQLATTVPPASLDDKVEYRNSKGELWSSRVEDVLTHVLFHSAYHRGQIALQMRAAGVQPAYTDFIHAVRQGLIE
jgi:uncharacterized damage-inducible protein DinB